MPQEPNKLEESFWEAQRSHFREAFSEQLSYKQEGDHPEPLDELAMRRRRDAFRYVLLLLAVILAPLVAHNILTEQWVPAIGSVILLTIFLVNILLLGRGREPFLTPRLVLVLTIALVFLSVIYGQTYTLYWLYPLLVALPVMLKPRWAAWIGALCGVIAIPLIFAQFEISTAIIVCLTMAHTWLVSAWLVFAVGEQSGQLRDMALTDPLTGCYNRRYLKIEAEYAMEVWRRYKRPASILLIDVDHFKRVNDKFGHAAGDEALQKLVDLVTARIRAVDSIIRFGGEEFVVMLTEAAAGDACNVAEELREMIESAEILPEGRMTISIGVSDVTSVESVDHWLNLSDSALYLAKSTGRNKVELASADWVPQELRNQSLPDWR